MSSLLCAKALILGVANEHIMLNDMNQFEQEGNVMELIGLQIT